jgi:hypothetical protein
LALGVLQLEVASQGCQVLDGRQGRELAGDVGDWQ